MRIAISTEGNEVSLHFGRCPFFTLVDLENGQITKKEVVENPGHQPGFIPQFLHQQNVACIICGGMGMRAMDLFKELGIQTIVGISGLIDDVLRQLQQGTLKGGESLCRPGAGKGYGVEKNACEHPEIDACEH